MLMPLFLLFSCVEEVPKEIEVTPEEIDRVVDKIHEGFFVFSVQGGTREQAFSVENEGMNGIYGVSRTDLENLDGESLSLFNCVNTLNPGILQKIKINEAINTFSICRYAVGLSYIAEIEILLEKSETERLEVIQRLEQGIITESETDTELRVLSQKFGASYLGIKNFYSNNFRTCLHTLVTEISVILENNQWQIFMKCIDS